MGIPVPYPDTSEPSGPRVPPPAMPYIRIRSIGRIVRFRRCFAHFKYFGGTGLEPDSQKPQVCSRFLPSPRVFFLFPRFPVFYGTISLVPFSIHFFFDKLLLLAYSSSWILSRLLTVAPASCWRFCFWAIWSEAALLPLFGLTRVTPYSASLNLNKPVFATYETCTIFVQIGAIKSFRINTCENPPKSTLSALE